MTAAPYETFNSLPHTLAALIPNPGWATRIVQLVVQRRGSWDVISQRHDCRRLYLNTDDEEMNWPPAEDQTLETAVVPDAGGHIRITSAYMYGEDGDYAADQWLIYVSDDGSNPYVGGVDQTINMVKVDGLAKLDVQAPGGPFGDGTLIKVGVRVYRSGVGKASRNADVFEATANTDGPAASTFQTRATHYVGA